MNFIKQHLPFVDEIMDRMFVLKALFLAVIPNVFGLTQLLVKTKVGSIRGVKAVDGDYIKFLGIPYARVDPVNPFGVPLPSPVFNSIFEANDDSVICLQLDSNNNGVIGTLDCLHLNIYIPEAALSQSSDLLPVMVWIHGGGFYYGSANLFGPKYLVRHDVIVVTINYRLGIHGFMCLDIPEVPGNQGLKDQLTALRWIRDNIQFFGGDANRVTIFGASAGAKSVDFHLMSHQEKLFNQVIMQSGSSLMRNVISSANPGAAFRLAEKLGFSTDNVYEALSFLAMNASSADVVLAARDTGLLKTSKVCVEKQFENVEDFVVDYPVNAKIPKARGTPILIGFNNDEQVYQYANKNPSFFNNLNVIEDLLKSFFEFFDTNQLKDMEEIVRSFYLGDKKVNDNGSMWDIIDFDSDFTIGYPTERTVNKFMENGADTVYYYIFSYIGGLNYIRNSRNIKIGGACHGDELGYLFHMRDSSNSLITAEDRLLIDRMTTMWTNFAKHGNPTPITTHILPLIWQPVLPGARFYLNISSELNLQKKPFHKRMAFWDLFYRLNMEQQKGYIETNSIYL